MNLVEDEKLISFSLDISFPTLEDLLSPARLEEGYTGSPAGPGPVIGHGFGMFLPEADKAALLAHLRSL